jgi:nicotinamide riboside transporter PnuC
MQMKELGSSIFDLSGTIIAIISVAFMVKKSTWYWYLSILCSILWFGLFMSKSAYIAGGLQISYILFSIYGMIRWRFEKNQKTPSQLLEYTGILLSLFTFSVAVLNTRFIDFNHYCELIGVCFLVAANWLTSRKDDRCWYFWMIGDIIFAIFLWNKQIYATFVAQAVFFALSIWGLFVWKKI